MARYAILATLISAIVELTHLETIPNITLENADPTLSPTAKADILKYKNISCEALQLGQYYCEEPEIDDETQQAVGCSQEEPWVKVNCIPVRGIWCDGKEFDGSSENIGFTKRVSCKWTNGKKFSTALLLSVFLGVFGIDRFYLGYPAIGLLKLCTLGFMLLGHLADILLIALQVVGPSDGSAYVIDFYGAGLSRMDLNNDTYYQPQHS